MLTISECPPDEVPTFVDDRVNSEENQEEPMFTANAWREGAQITTGLYSTLDEAQNAVENLVADGWTVLISTVSGLPVMMSAD
jgi:hypothetical protein